MNVGNLIWFFFFSLCHPQQNHARWDVMHRSQIKPLVYSQNERIKPSVFRAYHISLPRQQPQRYTSAAQYFLVWLEAIMSYHTILYLHYCGTLLALRLQRYRGTEPSELLDGTFEQTGNIQSNFWVKIKDSHHLIYPEGAIKRQRAVHSALRTSTNKVHDIKSGKAK